MSVSRHTRRAQRRQMKSGRAVPLNIVSMIDIFAILVFFLLINYWQVDVAVTQVKDVQLPESVSLQDPQQAIVVTITEKDILVQGVKVATVAEALKGRDVAIPSLQAALEQDATPETVVPAAGKPSSQQTQSARSRKVIIMGDKTIPYHLLKRVMLSCSQAKYSNISLAVIEKRAGHPG